MHTHAIKILDALFLGARATLFLLFPLILLRFITNYIFLWMLHFLYRFVLLLHVVVVVVLFLLFFSLSDDAKVHDNGNNPRLAPASARSIMIIRRLMAAVILFVAGFGSSFVLFPSFSCSSSSWS